VRSAACAAPAGLQRAIGTFQEPFRYPRIGTPIWTGAGYAHVELNTQAIEVYQRCIAWRLRSASLMREIGGVYQRLGNRHKALDAYAQSAPTSRSGRRRTLAMADCCVRQGDMERAASISPKGPRRRCPRPIYDVCLGDIYRKQGNLAKAAGAWRGLEVDAKRDDVRLSCFWPIPDAPAPGNGPLGERLSAGKPRDRPAGPFMKAWICLIGGIVSGPPGAMVVRSLAPTELVQHTRTPLGFCI